MKILLVTTWNTACGIAEHSAMLKEAVELADPDIKIEPSVAALDPHIDWALQDWNIDLVHLNYQAALHSRWTPDAIRAVRQYGTKVVVTYHDTGVPNSDQCKAIVDAADAAVVHEPFDDLPAEKVHYWRMGVPGWPGRAEFDRAPRSWCEGRPILGSIGFPFPWKHYDLLARVTAEVGWALYLIAPTASPEQVAAWEAINPHLQVRTDFVHRREAMSYLAACDATAFTYVCHNTGQSGAVLQGIAARKPVIALRTCRQFRALYEEYPRSIRWAEAFDRSADSVKFYLKTMPIERVDARTVYVAEQESWARLGKKYATLYRSLVA